LFAWAHIYPTDWYFALQYLFSYRQRQRCRVIQIMLHVCWVNTIY
jgi:hypothetical protein